MKPFITITAFVQHPVLVQFDQNDFMDLSIFKRPKKPFTLEKKNDLTTIFVFIVANQDTEWRTIKPRINESHQLSLVRYQSRSLLKFPL